MVFHLWWFVTSQPYLYDIKLTIDLPEITSSIIQKVFLRNNGKIIISPHMLLQTKCAAVKMFLWLHN